MLHTDITLIGGQSTLAHCPPCFLCLCWRFLTGEMILKVLLGMVENMLVGPLLDSVLRSDTRQRFACSVYPWLLLSWPRLCGNLSAHARCPVSSIDPDALLVRRMASCGACSGRAHTDDGFRGLCYFDNLWWRAGWTGRMQMIWSTGITYRQDLAGHRYLSVLGYLYLTIWLGTNPLTYEKHIPASKDLIQMDVILVGAVCGSMGQNPVSKPKGCWIESRGCPSDFIVGPLDAAFNP